MDAGSYDFYVVSLGGDKFVLGICIGFIIAKTNIHVLMLDTMFQHVLAFLRDVGCDVPTSWHGSVCPIFMPRCTRALSY
jgi:hypothetical protein